MKTTDAIPSPSDLPSVRTDETSNPEGPVPAPCPHGGHSPTRPSSAAVGGGFAREWAPGRE
jgi:hypothetical protein